MTKGKYDDLIKELEEANKITLKYLNKKDQIMLLTHGLSKDDPDIKCIKNELKWLQQFHNSCVNNIQVLNQASKMESKQQ